jgi:hypothetical protein
MSHFLLAIAPNLAISRHGGQAIRMIPGQLSARTHQLNKVPQMHRDS